jgi:hypothetical protein
MEILDLKLFAYLDIAPLRECVDLRTLAWSAAQESDRTDSGTAPAQPHPNPDRHFSL